MVLRVSSCFYEGLREIICSCVITLMPTMRRTILSLTRLTILSIGLAIDASPTFAIDAPEASFPFNSQVPLVARAEVPYKFQLSDTTFTSSLKVEYAISDTPTWLRIDATTRKLFGTPGKSDVGSVDFDILASDEDGITSMRARLIVAESPAPTINSEIDNQMKQQDFDRRPRSFLAYSQELFDFTFPKNLFRKRGSELLYYATMSDNSPLPSWLEFDNDGLRFWGITPAAEYNPQKYSLVLIASDFPGFAGARYEFSLMVTNRNLHTSPLKHNISVLLGSNFRYTGLQSALPQRVQPDDEDIKAIEVSPSDLVFDEKDLAVEGVAKATPQSIDVELSNRHGDVAEVTVFVNPGPGLIPHLGDVSVARGDYFNFRIPAREAPASMTLDYTVKLAGANSWLSFNRSDKSIQGNVPLDLDVQTVVIEVEVAAFELKLSEAQELRILVKPSDSPSGSPVSSDAIARSTETSRSSAYDENESQRSRKSIESGPVVAIAVSCLVLVVFLIITSLFYKDASKRKKFKKALKTRNISLPFNEGDEHNGILGDANNVLNMEKSCFERPYNITPQLPPVAAHGLRGRLKTPLSLERATETLYDNVKHNRHREELVNQKDMFSDPDMGNFIEKTSTKTPFRQPEPVIVYPGDRFPPIYGRKVETSLQCEPDKPEFDKHINHSSCSARTYSLPSNSPTPSAFPEPPSRKISNRRSTPLPFKLSKRRSELLTLYPKYEKRITQPYLAYRNRSCGESPFFSARSGHALSKSKHSRNCGSNSHFNRPMAVSNEKDASGDITEHGMTKIPPASISKINRDSWPSVSQEMDLSAPANSNRPPQFDNQIKPVSEISSNEYLGSSSQYSENDKSLSRDTSLNQSISSRRCESKPGESTRSASTLLVERPHPLTGRRKSMLERKDRLKAARVPSSRLVEYKHAPIGRTTYTFADAESRSDIEANKGLRIVFGLDARFRRCKGSEDEESSLECSRSIASESCQDDSRARLVDGKGRRPVSVHGTKKENEWGSMNVLGGSEAFL